MSAFPHDVSGNGVLADTNIPHLRESLTVGLSGYRKGCRCDGCRSAKRASQREHRSRPHVRARQREYERRPDVKLRKREYESRPEVRQRIRKWHRDYDARKGRHRRKERYAAINEMKLRSGCADCGYHAHPVALDFDHVSGVKLYDISDILSFDWKKVLAEISKCEVVCANCHRIRTYERKQRAKREKL